MIEFVAGVMVGGSLGAVIMGALLSRTRSVAGLRNAADMPPRALQAPRPAAGSARHARRTELPALLASGVLAAATSTVH